MAVNIDDRYKHQKRVKGIYIQKKTEWIVYWVVQHFGFSQVKISFMFLFTIMSVSAISYLNMRKVHNTLKTK